MAPWLLTLRDHFNVEMSLLANSILRNGNIRHYRRINPTNSHSFHAISPVTNRPETLHPVIRQYCFLILKLGRRPGPSVQ